MGSEPHERHPRHFQRRGLRASCRRL